jgi:hypothetical protein
MPLACSSVRLEIDHVRRNLGKTKWIYIGETERRGLGIFAARRFVKGELVLRDANGDYYDGAVSYRQVRALGLDLSRDCFQIADDRFLLPSGSIDDLINHSCCPNSGIRLTSLGYDLLALRDVAVGDEISYDYSTYIDSPERLSCECGLPCCRRQIGRFRDLDPRLRDYYLERGVVGAFAAAAVTVCELKQACEMVP